MNCPKGFALVTDLDECKRSDAPLGRRWVIEQCWATGARGCLVQRNLHLPFQHPIPLISFSTCNHRPNHNTLAGVCKGAYLVLQTPYFSISK